MLCGLVGRYDGHLEHVRDVIGTQPGAQHLRRDERADARRAARCSSPTPSSTRSRARSSWPTSPRMAADEVRRFGVPPKVAFLSHSIFGSSSARSAQRMREARELFRERAAATSSATARCTATPRCRRRAQAATCRETTLSGAANLLVLPNLDAANILFNVLKMTGGQRRDGRADPARRGPAGAHPDAVGDGAAHRQHDGAGGAATRPSRPRRSPCPSG